MRTTLRSALPVALALLFTMTSGANAGPRLDAIKARGQLHCGVATGEPGMSRALPSGEYAGFEPDLCRAIAIAIFGTPKVAFRPTTTLQNFLTSDDVDVVIRGLTWSFQREANANIRFGPIYFHDGQTFLVRAASNIRRIEDLSRRSVCVSSDMFADFLPALRRAFDARNLVLNAVSVRTRAEAERLFFEGGCEAVTADATELASAVIAQGGAPGTYSIMHGRITEEPLAPLLRKGDDQFFDIVRWAFFALVNAEDLGISSRNVDSVRVSTDPGIRAFFAAPPAASGLSPLWSAAIVKGLGNYGEIFDRHLAGPAGLERWPNLPWSKGGFLYAPPIR